MSAGTVSRLKKVWAAECDEWCKRSLDNGQWVYGWVDGIHRGLRVEDAQTVAGSSPSQCVKIAGGKKWVAVSLLKYRCCRNFGVAAW